MNSAIRSTLAVALTAIIVLAGCGGGGTTDPDGFERKSGSLSSGDDTLQSGEYSDEYTVNVEAGQMLEVSMTSTEIDPWIIVLPPSCDSVAGVACSSQTDNDDMESGNTDAYAWIKAEEAGTWRIVATSYVPNETGAYELAYRAVDAGSNPATPGVSTFGATTTMNGTLGSGDETLESGEYTDRYIFAGSAGDRIGVSLRSTDFDTYVIVYSPNDTQEDNDDWEVGEFGHSRVEMTLPADGLYQVNATTYEPGEEGAYSLEVGLLSGGSDASAGGDATADPFEKN